MMTVKSMKMKHVLAMALLSAAFGLNASCMSENGIFVISAPDRTSFWRTATNNVVLLPVYFPKGAASAALEVRGDRYLRRYGNLQPGHFELTLPKPERPEDENVYELTLAFDDGTVRNARFAVIAGVGDKSFGSTRCVFDTGSASWTSFNRRAVLPIPEGVDAFSVNGKNVELGACGGRDWHVLAASRQEGELELALTAADGVHGASLLGYAPGFMLFLR